MLHRREMLLSILGGSLAAAFAGPPAQAFPAYPQISLPAIPIRNLTGFDAVAGASAASRLLVGGEHGVIVYSDDAAKTWHQADVPASVTITNIAFVTPEVGWATGSLGVVLRTQDGGKTWVKQLDGLEEIDLMNTATQVYVASQPAGSDQAVRATRRAQILTQSGPDKPMLAVLPISTSKVLIFGSYRFADYSTDGGKSWTDWSLHIGDPMSHNIYDAAAIGGAYYVVGEEGLIFRSTDGGQSFPQLAQVGMATLFGITDVGGGAILVYGVSGSAYLSADAGKTWNPCKFAGTDNINAVVRLASGPLVAGDSGGGLWVSKDNGQSFSLVMRNPLMSVNALQPIDGPRFLLLSMAGIIPLDLSSFPA
ncbi:hypothetical protein GCM10010909_37340 [Acidocella aquatica]|uniref:Photosynthesis system II assembly factor Ycf48/Hcf136-like domain-containing protein n=1 Tax=Acidocella aquatica TaxID=1922313 RepID=A0ABQ6AA36_9PROT|nr:YCF48-related protein [Acidocella aquatica]GLR69051.1 hypothetical protein GCM10010909_37340 [Acidocella aquatica]